MISKFLPTDFDKSAKTAILAGKGAYPSLVKDRLDAAGIPNAKPLPNCGRGSTTPNARAQTSDSSDTY